MSMAPTLLSVENLSKSYGGVHAVRSVSFELRAGEILALIGPNGAGKSTCFDMLNGQNIPDSGRVNLLGEDTVGRKPRAGVRVGKAHAASSRQQDQEPLQEAQRGLSEQRRRPGVLQLSVVRHVQGPHEGPRRVDQEDR